MWNQPLSFVYLRFWVQSTWSVLIKSLLSEKINKSLFKQTCNCNKTFPFCGGIFYINQHKTLPLWNKLSDISDFRGHFVIGPSELRITWAQKNRSPWLGVYFNCMSPEQLPKSVCRIIFKNAFTWGTWVAQSEVKHLTPDFSSERDYRGSWDRVPHLSLHWQCWACLGFLLSLSASPLLIHALSLPQNK